MSLLPGFWDEGETRRPDPARRPYLGLGAVVDVHHVDGVLALVFALLFVLLLEDPLLADAEAAGQHWCSFFSQRRARGNRITMSMLLRPATTTDNSFFGWSKHLIHWFLSECKWISKPCEKNKILSKLPTLSLFEKNVGITVHVLRIYQ